MKKIKALGRREQRKMTEERKGGSTEVGMTER